MFIICDIIWSVSFVKNFVYRNFFPVKYVILDFSDIKGKKGLPHCIDVYCSVSFRFCGTLLVSHFTHSGNYLIQLHVSNNARMHRIALSLFRAAPSKKLGWSQRCYSNVRYISPIFTPHRYINRAMLSLLCFKHFILCRVFKFMLFDSINVWWSQCSI